MSEESISIPKLALIASAIGTFAYGLFSTRSKQDSTKYENVTCPATGRTYKIPKAKPTTEERVSEESVSTPTANAIKPQDALQRVRAKVEMKQSGQTKLPKPRRGQEPVQYHSYLELDSILSSQKPKSWVEGGTHAHDEHLFIIVHQASELWLKQIIHDMTAVCEVMAREHINEEELGKVVERLNRVVQTIKLLIDHLKVLETMTPLSFLEFRDYLFPASGFQSMQFRVLEVVLGLKRKTRLCYAGTQFDCALTPEQMETIQDLEKQPSLFDLVDKWLQRLPVLKTKEFDFWKEYQNSVHILLEEEKEGIARQLQEGMIPTHVYENRMSDITGQEKFFRTFFDYDSYQLLVHSGEKRMSHKACQSALMINFYQEMPLFQLPYQILCKLIEIDQLLSTWRSTHASMVHKMLGLKMGTGGSSGYQYLLGTVRHHRVFNELCDLASLMVPRSYLPCLPDTVSIYTTFIPRNSTEPTENTGNSSSTNTSSNTMDGSIKVDEQPEQPEQQRVQQRVQL